MVIGAGQRRRRGHPGAGRCRTGLTGIADLRRRGWQHLCSMVSAAPGRRSSSFGAGRHAQVSGVHLVSRWSVIRNSTSRDCRDRQIRLRSGDGEVGDFSGEMDYLYVAPSHTLTHTYPK
ncbi:hypothetical protein M6B38_294265 [Iris pallida]|uniref:Uncharacterized protein n=1 Tax=Iris pallida TaxID=29817 RepID=A0AAX6GSI4_IRIPA|nr:hypothetical protein M6B38_350080 [Iris pallida]KAJ6844032.1 hypothetical protein M6B38_294265 [Iris pallida]